MNGVDSGTMLSMLWTMPDPGTSSPDWRRLAGCLCGTFHKSLSTLCMYQTSGVNGTLWWAEAIHVSWSCGFLMLKHFDDDEVEDYVVL